MKICVENVTDPIESLILIPYCVTADLTWASLRK